MMWHSYLYHESSYVWDLILAHLVKFTPGFGAPKNPGVSDIHIVFFWGVAFLSALVQVTLASHELQS
jgi:hypothetical protein